MGCLCVFSGLEQLGLQSKGFRMLAYYYVVSSVCDSDPHGEGDVSRPVLFDPRKRGESIVLRFIFDVSIGQ